MTIDRNKFYLVTICCCLSLCGTTANALSLQQQQQHQQQHQQQQQSNKDDAKHQPDAAGAFESPRNFNPRMDYNNEWRPVGRGDPLQNDPTYDYSPPALERVRYWAADNGEKENNNESGTAAAAGSGSGNKAAASSKNEILLLGVSNERMRPTMPHALKNAKGELPLLQPKYSSIRRSYYAHQLPTHLMPPPPMQGFTASGGSGMHNLMKPSGNAVDYRHSMPLSSFTNAGSTLSSMAGAANMKHTKPYYSTAATSPWTHMHSTVQHSHSSPPSTTTTTMSTQHGAHGLPYGALDSQQHESAHYLSYTRPGLSHAAETYSPNAIRPSQHATKTGSAASARKPWLHELLQKEINKPVRPTMPATKFLMGPATKPSYDVVSSHAVIYSTTHKPINFVTTSTTNMPHRHTSLPPVSYASSPVYITSTSLPTTTTTTTTTTTPSPFYQAATRLLIPETSNLAFRPTVAPMEMTTDALFSHYNQPEKPLMGPMYLIIEGHSKVKTYGKDELDPHRPKIVPIIPKREPIVRIADPNEQRGSVATFQVKHLHTVTTPATTTTTWKPTTTKPVTKAITTTMRTMTTTSKPTIMKTSIRPATMKASVRTTTTTTTNRPTVKTTMRQTTTTTTVKPTTLTSRATEMPLKLTTSNGLRTTNQMSSASSTILSNIQDFPTQPPTGMQGLLSLLDASFGSFFENEPTGMDAELTKQQQQQPQAQLQNPQLESRVGTKGGTISAYSEDFLKEPEDTGITTELAPREVRHIYDYEQLSDSRLKQLLSTNYDDDEEYEDSMDDGIKRYDKVMDYAEEDKVEHEEYDNEEAEDDEEVEEDEDQDDVEKNVRVARAKKT